MRLFGHGKRLGALQGTQAEQALVPMANLTLRRIPDGLSDEVALFAGDVMATGYHAVSEGEISAGDSVAVLGLGPVGLCAVQVAVSERRGAGGGDRLGRGSTRGRARIWGHPGSPHPGDARATRVGFGRNLRKNVAFAALWWTNCPFKLTRS